VASARAERVRGPARNVEPLPSAAFDRRRFVAALALAVAALPRRASAQPAGKVPRIGYLVLSPLVDPPSAERQAFLEGLRDLGYAIGRNVVIEYRSANWNRELLADLADELVKVKVDVIVAVPGTDEAAREATKTIPIVIPAAEDLVERKVVASLARPGGNITGTAFMPLGFAGKRLELLKEAIPKASLVAVMWSRGNPGNLVQWSGMQSAARALGVTVESLEVNDPKDVPDVLAAMTRRRPHALMIVASPLTTAYRPILIEFATKNRLPTMMPLPQDVEAGGLISYAPNLTETFRRSAKYVDRILKGAKPADLPIEQPTKFELVINLKTAKALGLTIPQSLLLRADRVIQ
jgi:putative ABC transport system substrate-binding protein